VEAVKALLEADERMIGVWELVESINNADSGDGEKNLKSGSGASKDGIEGGNKNNSSEDGPSNVNVDGTGKGKDEIEKKLKDDSKKQTTAETNKQTTAPEKPETPNTLLINSETLQARTPLYVASRAGHAKVVKVLLDSKSCRKRMMDVNYN
jgi:hypothetical protein